MDNLSDNKKTRKNILLLAIFVIVLLLVGTYAWLSYQTKKTAMVLTLGDISNIQVTLSPYQIDATLSPKTQYTSGILTNVTAANSSTSAKKIDLFYRITSIDSSLRTNDFKYTIVRTNDNQTYTGNFSTATAGTDMVILTQSIPATTTYTYEVYLWIDGYTNQNASGGTFEGELRASILSHVVTFDANGGTVPISSKEVTTGETYGTLPTPTRDGYTFLGWNGKNLINYNILNNTMINQGITVGTDGYISDSTPTSDTRGWNYSYNHGWRIYLDSGIYTVSLNFSTPSTTGDNRIVVQPQSETMLVNVNFANKSSVSSTFSLNNSETINVVAKGYNGIYRIQIEEGSTVTPWEPYYISSSTTVVQDSNHVLTAIWQAN